MKIKLQKPRRPANPTGLAIAAARKAAGLTQRALAIAIGVCSLEISRWERGACTPPPAKIQAVAERCGTTISIVYGHTGARKVVAPATLDLLPGK